MMKEILFILILAASNIIQTITGFAGGPLAMPPAIALLGIADARAAITLIFWFSTLIVTLQNLKYVNWKKLGIILFLAPWETLIVFAVWAVIVGLTRIVSLGSIVAAILVPITMCFFAEPMPVTIFGLVAAILVVVRHKDNIIRLLQGKEVKVERIKK